VNDALLPDFRRNMVSNSFVSSGSRRNVKEPGSIMDFDEDLKKLVTLDNKVIAKVRVEEEVAAECEKSQRVICRSL
jgi:hypothetical protein